MSLRLEDVGVRQLDPGAGSMLSDGSAPGVLLNVGLYQRINCVT